MKYDMANRRLELEIRTRSYRVILDLQEGTVRLAKACEESDWQISLRSREGGCATC
ncbi:MAG: hypothetical protein PHU53_03800 [Thermoplasmata archaeon]|nr:hypothetical protein [Thermoplasmata archaeon]